MIHDEDMKKKYTSEVTTCDLVIKPLKKRAFDKWRKLSTNVERDLQDIIEELEKRIEENANNVDDNYAMIMKLKKLRIKTIKKHANRIKYISEETKEIKKTLQNHSLYLALIGVSVISTYMII